MKWFKLLDEENIDEGEDPIDDGENIRYCFHSIKTLDIEEVTQLDGRLLETLKRGEFQQLVAGEWSVRERGIHED